MSFLDTAGADWIEGAGGEPEPEVQVVQPEQEQVTPEPAPDEPAPDVPEQDAEAKTAQMVPLAEKQKAIRRAQEAERELADLRANVPAPKPKPIPDAYEQPEEFNRYQEDQRAADKFEMRAEISGFRAEQLHGKETVEAAVQWAQAQNDPALGLKVRQAASPVELVVQEYQRSRTLDTLSGKSLEDYAKDYAVQQGWIVSPEQTAPNPKPSSSPTPPRSLASRPGSGGISQTASGDAFGEVFAASGMGLKK